MMIPSHSYVIVARAVHNQTALVTEEAFIDLDNVVESSTSYISHSTNFITEEVSPPENSYEPWFLNDLIDTSILEIILYFFL